MARRLLRVVKSRRGTKPVPLWLVRAIRTVGSGTSPLAPHSRPASSSKIGSAELGRLLEGVELGTWALGPRSIDALVELVAVLRPARIMEFGSGSSTVVLAWAIRQACGPGDTPRIISIEQDAGQAARTEGLLRGAGLDGEAVVFVAPLGEQEVEGHTTICYQLPDAMADAFGGRLADLVVIDGPAGPAGVRFGTLPLARPFARPGAAFVLDDALRDGELDVARRWARLPWVHIAGIRLIDKGILTGTVGTA
jgi:predicted O-methyltransferase YrrM